MDILSILPQSTAAPRALGSPPTRGRPSPAEAPDRPDPANAPTGQTAGQKEAIGQGQKTRQTLLDLLENAVPGSQPWVSDASARAVLSEISLPPTLDDMVKALAAMGVPLPTGAVQPSVPNLVSAVASSAVPQEAQAALVAVLQGAKPAPVAASAVIDLERPNPVPAPVVNRPVPAPRPMPEPHADVLPKPHADTGPVPHADLPPDASSAVVGRNAADTRPAATARPLVEAVATQGGTVDPAAASGTFAVVGPPVRSGQVLPAGLAEALNLDEVQTAPADEPIDSLLKIAPKPGGLPLKDDIGFEGSVDPTSGTTGDGKNVLGRPVPQPQPHAEIGDVPDKTAGLGRPDRSTDTKPLGRPERNADTVPVPTPKPKAEAAPTAKPERTARTDSPDETLFYPATEPATGPDRTVKSAESVAIKETSDVQKTLDPASTVMPETFAVSEDVAVSSTIVPDPAAAAPKTEERAPLPQKTVESIQRQVADRIETMVAGRRSGSVTVRLNPTDLGTITLTVKSLGSRVDTDIKASHEDVRLALQAHRQDLVQNVESRGLTMNSFNVGQEAQPQSGGQDHRAAFTEAQRQANLKSVATSPTEDRRPQPTAYRAGITGVDYLA